MTINATTLRPGFLVSLKTSLTGNVSYQTREIEPEHDVDGGARRARWETEKQTANAAEQEAGTKARAAARTAVTRICSLSTFGLLCPEARAQELGAGIAEARRIAEEFNRTATVTQLYVGVIVGRVAADDAEAVKAINQEVRGLLDAMDRGIRAADVPAIRDAASRARELGQMLQPAAAQRVQVAIDAARAAARKLVKAGEQAAAEIDQATLQAVASARTAFLDLDTAAPSTEPAEPMAPEARALDLEPVPPEVAGPAIAAPGVPQLEIG